MNVYHYVYYFHTTESIHNTKDTCNPRNIRNKNFWIFKFWDFRDRSQLLCPLSYFHSRFLLCTEYFRHIMMLCRFRPLSVTIKTFNISLHVIINSNKMIYYFKFHFNKIVRERSSNLTIIIHQLQFQT